MNPLQKATTELANTLTLLQEKRQAALAEVATIEETIARVNQARESLNGISTPLKAGPPMVIDESPEEKTPHPLKDFGRIRDKDSTARSFALRAVVLKELKLGPKTIEEIKAAIEREKLPVTNQDGVNLIANCFAVLIRFKAIRKYRDKYMLNTGTVGKAGIAAVLRPLNGFKFPKTDRISADEREARKNALHQRIIYHLCQMGGVGHPADIMSNMIADGLMSENDPQRMMRLRTGMFAMSKFGILDRLGSGADERFRVPTPQLNGAEDRPSSHH